jgi:hypothetical protein
MQLVFLSESFDLVIFMLLNPAVDVTCYTGVERTITLVGHNVHTGLF